MTRSFLEGREPLTVAGRKWLLDRRQLIDKSIFGGAWEPLTTKAIQALVKPGMTALDVGANIGWYTVILSELVGSSGRVVAFEPMAEPASLVRRHIEINQIQNAEVREVALDDRDWDEESGFFNYSWALARQDDPVDQPKNGISHRTLDGLRSELRLPRVDFLKIDVDGYEAKMLRGARETLKEHHPVLLLEVCEYTLRTAAGKPYLKSPYPEYGEEVRAMLEDLLKLGYRLYREDTFAEVTVSEALGMADLSVYSINLVVKT